MATEEKKPKPEFAEIRLDDLIYNKEGIALLIEKLQKLKDRGFTTFSTSYSIGYYDEVEEISLTFQK